MFKHILKKSLGIIAVDISFILLLILPQIRKNGSALFFLGFALAVMTGNSIYDGINEAKNRKSEDSPASKILYDLCYFSALTGIILLLIKIFL